MTLRIKEKEIELVDVDSGGSCIIHHKGKPFTGIVLFYEDEDWLSLEEEYQNGYLEGWTRSYHENGQLEEEYFLHNNEIKSGTHNLFDEDGNQLNIL